LSTFRKVSDIHMNCFVVLLTCHRCG
jgi:predicted nucleic-acid-binding Zn-ribbon protein